MAEKSVRLPISFDSFRERFSDPISRIAFVRRWPGASSEMHPFSIGAVAPEDFAILRTDQRGQACGDRGIDRSNWPRVIICHLSVAPPPPCALPIPRAGERHKRHE